MAQEQKIWLEFSVVAPEPLADVIANFFTELTNRGVKLEDIGPHPEEGFMVRVTGYLAPEQADLIKKIYEFLAALEEEHPGEVKLALETRPLPEEDWACAWQEYFKPLKIGKRLVIKPSWEKYVPQPEEIVIEIDPGRAFGTGHHPSTYLVLERLETLFEELFGPHGLAPYVLDVGTGTGILALAAAKLGAQEVLAVDIDPEAAEVARENVLRNHLHQIVRVSTTPVWEIADTFDLIMANISAYELKLLGKKLAELLRSGGRLLLSGFLKEEGSELWEAYKAYGLKLVYQKVDPEFGEWMLFDLKRL